MSTRTAYRICPLCEATCGLEITLDGDRVTVIRGDRDNLFSGGFICPKGSTLGRLHDDPDRLRAPLVRRDGRLVEVGWDEAFAEVEARLLPILERHGRDALAVYVGNPNAHGFANNLAIRPLLKALGTKNAFSASTVDQMPRHVACGYLYGSPSAIPVPDLDRTDFLLILGANPLESNGSLATAPDWPGRLDAIRARGGSVVVVDPRRTRTAEAAGEHVPIRPGTDAALLFGLARVVFEEGLVRLGHLDGRVAGVEEVRAAADPFTLGRVEAFTGVPATVVEDLARRLAAAPTAAVYGRIGTHTVEFGTLAAWLADVLNVLTGNLDRAGGVMFPQAAHLPRRRKGRPFVQGRWRSRVRGLPETVGELPVATLVDEIETPGEGRVRALLTIAGNPVCTTPDAGRLDRALATLELVVSVDPYVNETTRHAHVILPPPSALQRSHYDLAFTTLSVRNYAAYTPAVLPLEEGRPSEFDILVRLTAIASGLGAGADPAALVAFTLAGLVQQAVADPASPVHGRRPEEIHGELTRWEGPEQILDLMLRTGAYGDGFGAVPGGLTLEMLAAGPHGIDFGPLQPRLDEVLTTASGRVELAPEAILADVPRLVAALDRESPDGLLLVGRRQVRTANSWTHNVEVLVKGRDACTLQVNPADAARLGLRGGAAARLRSRVGEVEAPVEVTDAVMAGVVSLPYGWGHDRDGARLSVASRRPGANANLLTDPEPLDPLSGNAVLNGIPVTVTPA